MIILPDYILLMTKRNGLKVSIKGKSLIPRKRKEKERELTRLGAVLRGLGSLGGGAAGGLIGLQAQGSQLGNSLGAAISRWLGSGDYEVSSNSITKLSMGGTIPSMHKTNQSIIVRHKEFLGPIKSHASIAGAFNIDRTLPINPGVLATFPWLSAIASNFQEYTIRGMVYHYVPTSGNAVSSTNPALGSVMIVTNYKATDNAPLNKIEMLNEYYSNEARSDVEFAHPIECDPKENPFNIQYVRTGTVPSNEDPKTYDLGKTYVATEGQQAINATLGDLWITYEVELRKPMMGSINSGGGLISINGSSSVPTNTNCFNGLVNISGNVPLTYASNVITLPAGLSGYFLIVSEWDGATAIAGYSVAYTNAVSASLLPGTSTNTGTINPSFTAITATQSRPVCLETFVVSDPSDVVLITYTLSTLTAATGSRFALYRIASFYS